MKIVVVGGTSGIGKYCVENLRMEGHTVISGGRRESGHGNDQFLDLECEESVLDFFSELGPIDALVFAAGTTSPKEDPEKFDLDDFKRILNINLGGALLCLKYAVPLLKKTKGSIVLVSSMAARTKSEFSSISYSASKAGLGAVVRQYSDQLAPFGVRINSLVPSMVKTAMLEKVLGNKRINELSHKLPLHKLLELPEIYSAIKFLISPENQYMTGVGLDISGGLYLNG